VLQSRRKALCSCLQAYADVWHLEGIPGTLQVDVSAVFTVRMHHASLFTPGKWGICAAAGAAAACTCEMTSIFKANQAAMPSITVSVIQSHNCKIIMFLRAECHSISGLQGHHVCMCVVHVECCCVMCRGTILAAARMPSYVSRTPHQTQPVGTSSMW
jgi:hypothetical protein